MNEPNEKAPAAHKPPPSLEGVAAARVVIGGVAFVLTLITLYLSFWILVDALGIAKSKAPVAIPLIVGFGATQLVKPSLPTRGEILEGAVKIPLAGLRRYFWREVAAAVLGIGIGVSVLAMQKGALIPLRSEVEEVKLSESGTATIQLQQKLVGAPKFVDGLLVSLLVVAFGTAFAAVSGAHQARKLTDVVRGMEQG